MNVRRIISTWVVLLAFLVAGSLLAQEAATPPAVGADAGALIARIGVLLTDVDRLESQLEVAQGEFRLIRQRRIVDKKVEALEKINALAEVVASREKEGGEASTEREQATGFLLRATPLIQQHVQRVEKALESVAKDPTALSGSERSDLERLVQLESERVNSTYRALLANVEHLELLGLPSEAARAFLERKLVDRAEDLVARIEVAQDDAQALKARLKAEAGDSEVKARVVAANRRLQDSTDMLSATIALLRDAGVEASAYQAVLVEHTGKIGTDLLDSRVAVRLVDQWTESVRAWVSKSGPGWLVRLFFFLLILALARLLAGLVRRLVSRAVAASKFGLSQLLQRMIINTATQTVWVIGFLIALAQFGISLAPLLAGLGIAGFIVGFALQDTLSNFASGMMILLYRPYDVGDAIEAGGVFGKVNKMNLVSTTILTVDNQTLVIPNSKIWGDVIKNVTAQTQRRVDMLFGISYQDDIPQAEKLFEAILAAHPKVLADPEPVVRLHNLGDSSVDFIVRPWVETDDYWEVFWDVTRTVKMRCDEEGISIPYPQQDLHLYTASPEVLDPQPGKDRTP